MRCHASDLPVFSFTQDQFKPGCRNRLAEPDWRTPRPQAFRLRNLPDICRPGREISQPDPPGQGCQRFLGRFAFHLNEITLWQFMSRISDFRLQCTVIGKHHETLRIGVEATRRIDVALDNEVSKSRPPLCRRELRQHAVGLVEQDQRAHGRAALSKQLRKRCASG